MNDLNRLSWRQGIAAAFLVVWFALLPSELCLAQSGDRTRARKVSHPLYYAYVPNAAASAATIRAGRLPTICYLHGTFAEVNFAGTGIDPGAGTFNRLEDTFFRWAARGYLVLVPRWQGTWFPFPEDFANVSGADLERILDEMGTWDFQAQESTSAVLRAFFSQVDFQRFAIGGHSLGAMFALKLANEPVRFMPAPKAIILHEPAGFAFAPFVWPNIPFGMGDTSHDFTLFPSITPSAQLVCLMAESSFFSAWSGPQIPGLGASFGNHNAGGAVSRAYYNTPLALNKQFLLVADNGLVESDHLGIYRSGIREVYWKQTEDALTAAFASRRFIPNVSEPYASGAPKVFRLTPWFIAFPAPYNSFAFAAALEEFGEEPW